MPSNRRTNNRRVRAPEGSKGSLVIGIDFGTTYSGVAWATAADFERENINFISTWPGSGRGEGKVPSEISYSGGKIAWGYGIPNHAPRIQWFKLLLLKDKDLSPGLRSSSYLQSARDTLRKLDKEPLDVIADYLRELWKYAQHSLEKSLGRSVVDALPFRVVLTVPALWKGYARQSMEQAAKKAGIMGNRHAGPTQLSIVPEPEAASFPTLIERYNSVNKGDVYVVCDAGGGTVDLITYEIESVNPVRMREAVEGAGGLCGGVFIDYAFERMCRDRLGQSWKNLSREGKNIVMKENWEYSIKCQFRPGNPQKPQILDLPHEIFLKGSQPSDDTTKQPVIKRGRIHFKEHQIKETFTTAFTGIENLVNAQIQKATEKGLQVTGLILVGGLGGSLYLYDYMKAKLAKRNILVLQPDGVKPRTAICQGAVCKGFLDGTGQTRTRKPIEITSTISRASYGVPFNEPFNKNKHLMVDREWDSDEGKYKAMNQMSWYLKKGECVSKKNPIERNWYQIFDSDWDGCFSEGIYQCEDAVPPGRKTSSVDLMCMIDCTLGDCIPVSRLKTHKTPEGKLMKKLSYNINMIPSGRSVDFDVAVNGKSLGKTNVEVKF